MKFSRPEILSYEGAIRFHGHNGPFLALGYKLGKYLNQGLKPKGIMDFKITVIIKFEKPFTCLIDGLQCSTFATFGKANMMVKKSKNNDILVFVQKGEKNFTIQITKKAMDMCFNAEDLGKAAKKIFKTPPKKLWKII
jgi:formylmethanofuran dehydrogenase subunit E